MKLFIDNVKVVKYFFDEIFGDFLEFYKTNKRLFASKLTVINILSNINRK